MSEKYFTTRQNRNEIVKIFKCSPISVTYVEFECQEQRQFHVCVEKATSINLIQLRLTNLIDESWMTICTLDTAMFEKIKTDQSLHVTFQEFVDHLTNILTSCKKGELCISLQKKENASCRLNIFERRSFRNLTHLYLAMEKAPLETVLYHLSEKNSTLQQHIGSLTDQVSILKEDFSRKEDLCLRLQAEVAQMPDKIEEQRRKAIQEKLDEIEDFKRAVKQLQLERVCEEKRMQEINMNNLEKLEQIKGENHRLNQSISEHSAKVESLAKDLVNLRMVNRQLTEENSKLQENLEEIHNSHRKHDMNSLDLRKQLKNQREKIVTCEKQISELQAELEAEKNICRTKRTSLQIATDENTKANSIILKLKRKNDSLMEKFLSSRDHAAKQDKIIADKNHEIEKIGQMLKDIEAKMKQCKGNDGEILTNIDNINDAVDAIEEKYTRKLGELTERLFPLNPVEKRSNTLQQRNRI
ncbi:Spindle assembly abnormal protein 6 homolog [Sergentomyia squamirostris]